MVDDDALTYKGFWCGDRGDSLENYSVKMNLLAGTDLMPGRTPMMTTQQQPSFWCCTFAFRLTHEDALEYVCTNVG